MASDVHLPFCETDRRTPEETPEPLPRWLNGKKNTPAAPPAARPAVWVTQPNGRWARRAASQQSVEQSQARLRLSPSVVMPQPLRHCTVLPQLLQAGREDASTEHQS